MLVVVALLVLAAVGGRLLGKVRRFTAVRRQVTNSFTDRKGLLVARAAALRVELDRRRNRPALGHRGRRPAA